MNIKALKEAGIHCLQLLDEQECANYIAKLANDPNWGPARVHYGQAEGKPGRYKPEMRLSEANGLYEAPELTSQMEKRVKARVLPIVNRMYRTHYDTIGEHQAVRYDIGGHFKVHTDSGRLLESRQFTTLCYLNDDLEGGETTFPDFSIAVKPKAGMAITFPSEYRHGALPLLSGKKYVYLCWITSEPVKWL